MARVFTRFVRYNPAISLEILWFESQQYTYTNRLILSKKKINSSFSYSSSQEGKRKRRRGEKRSGTTKKKRKNLPLIHQPWPRIQGGRKKRLAQSWVEINRRPSLLKNYSFRIPALKITNNNSNSVIIVEKKRKELNIPLSLLPMYPIHTSNSVNEPKSKQRKKKEREERDRRIRVQVNPPIYPPSQFIDLIVHKPLGVTDVARWA